MAYQIPYNQPRIYVNYASWLQRIGAITRNSMFYYRDGSSQSVGSDWSFHSSSNQTKSGIWELEPHNYYRLFPSLELADYAGDYNTFYMRQYVSEQVEDVNDTLNPIYNVRSRLLNNVLESMEYDGNGYLDLRTAGNEIVNNATTPTGDVLLSTKNFAVGDNYTIIVEFR